MPERVTRKEGMLVTTVRLPRKLVMEIDHLLADLPHTHNLFGRPRSRSGLIEHLLRYTLTHQEEALAGWKPPRGNRGKRLLSLTGINPTPSV